jgi:hypothetical protein
LERREQSEKRLLRPDVEHQQIAAQRAELVAQRL